MKTKNYFLLVLGVLGLSVTTLKAQMAINNSAASPDASAILDLQTGNTGVNKGFLPQSVSLTDVTIAAPVTAPATGLIVYSSTAPTGGFGTGYYYWNGTVWTGLGGGASSIGGSGINNYVARWTPNANTLGTGMIQDDGNTVGINIAPQAGDMLYVNSTNGTGIYGNTINLGSAGVFGMGDTGVSGYGYATDFGIGISAVSQNNTGIFSDAYWGGGFAGGQQYGVWGQDGQGDYAVLGYSFGALSDYFGIGVYSSAVSYGIYGTGGTTGGYLTDNNGDYAYLGYNAGDGIDAYGNTYGGYFSCSSGDYGYSGNGYGLYGNSTTGYPNGAGVYGFDNNTISGAYGVWGSSTTNGVGVDGDATTSFDEGVQGRALTASGYPLIGWMDEFATSSTDPVIWAYNSYNGASVYMNYFDGTTQWKITGTGSVGSVVKDNKGEEVRLAAPEAPEVMFEDYGGGQLVNGKAHIDLDPTVAKNVTINEKHPLRAYVQLEGDCNGVYVTNKTATGFDVVELKGGTSNTSFQWHIVCNRADETMGHGQVSHNANVRFAKVDAENAKKGIAMLNRQNEAKDKAKDKAKAPAHKIQPATKPAKMSPSNPSASTSGKMIQQPNTQK